MIQHCFGNVERTRRDQKVVANIEGVPSLWIDTGREKGKRKRGRKC
jgi:hypothetical protein